MKPIRAYPIRFGTYKRTYIGREAAMMQPLDEPK
eukprot:CAMPEP_0184334544 /NCGR_PEP_ID=MMETSP1089-20130417/3296_1 /TAXON_ID=38269 ORGANISM="Gloeochaete wittrockiana, Strain SAG46.84" /NCGR_SAMPLE_ID=MMETSP1089 /ASSEMBLY_ACC=CAM_ASM_000445 /LENGTH=33 /DNA_ID= /DNA_START= /DNA_END= /DNA_ORIENTATION=